jgi:hypothetical protein
MAKLNNLTREFVEINILSPKIFLALPMKSTVVPLVVSEKSLFLNFDQSETSIVHCGLVWSPIRKLATW